MTAAALASALASSIPAAIAWVTLPLFAGFSSYLAPKLARPLALAVGLLSFGYGLLQVLVPSVLTLHLLDSFGVTLVLDSLSGYAILTNAIVTLAVIVYHTGQDRPALFYMLLMVLHGSVNSAFICADFISLYVALETVGIASFLLIAFPRTNYAVWIGLRYLLVGNTAMLLYLLGAILVYQSSGSFAYLGLATASPEAIAFVLLGLLVKGGVFVSGLWLPLTHAEAESPVSALLSGVVVKTGVVAIARCTLVTDELLPLAGLFGVATAVLGVIYAIAETDLKRMLAASTIAQMGFIIVAPGVAGFYTLTHGLAKAVLFLGASKLPSRDLKTLATTPVSFAVWLPVALAGLSVSGFPLLAGFSAKALVLKSLGTWQTIALNAAAVGTAIVFAKLLFLPVARGDKAQSVSIKPGVWLALGLPLSGLFLANGFHLEMYAIAQIGKALLTVAAGWLIYRLGIRRLTVQLPQAWERIDHLIGAMSLLLLALLGMVGA